MAILRLSLALAALIGFCSAASAGAVVVENPGANAFTGENTLSIHGVFASQELVLLKCAVSLEGSIGESGHASFGLIDFAEHSGSNPRCSQPDDCNAAGWEGQIEEGHPDTPWEYSIHVDMCFEGFDGPLASLLNDIIFPMDCELAPDEMHCGGTHDGEEDPAEQESFFATIEVAPGIFVPFFVEGELSLDNPLELMHEQ